MFYLRYKRENPSHVLGCSLCCVCESSVRSRGGCLHIHLGFPRFKIDVENLVINLIVDSRA